MHREEICEAIKQMGFSTENLSFRQYIHEEDEEPYQVFEVLLNENKYILKKSKSYEAQVYSAFLAHSPSYAPRIFAQAKRGEEIYLLMEYIKGENLQNCSREKMRLALDAMICMQREFWNAPACDQGYSYDSSLQQRKNRRDFLKDGELEIAYDRFLEYYSTAPRTLCHDDLLPFNVIASENRAVLIDWEYGGILPYPVSLARLIAHGREEESSLFYMTEKDKAFAIQYYYENLLCPMGIAYEDYRRSLDYFLFYEYCEWVYVGHKYGNTDGEYFKLYLPLAKAMARKLR